MRKISWREGKGMTTYSSILTWRVLWIEEPEGLEPIGRKDSNTTEVT